MKKLLTLLFFTLISFSQLLAQCTTAFSTVNENFDAVTDYAPHPSCWTVHNRTGVGNTYIMPNITYAHSGMKSLRIGYASGPGTDIMYVVLPMVTNVDGDLSFYAKTSGSSMLEIGTMSGQNDTASFALVQTVTINNTYQQFTISNMSGSDQYIAFRFNVDNNWMVLDDVVYDSATVVVPSSCDTTINTFTEGFENYMNYHSSPTCWTIYTSNNNSTTYVLDNPSYASSGTKSFRLGYLNLSGTSTILVALPKVANINGILTFQAKTNGSVPLIIGTSPLGTALVSSFTAFDTIFHNNTYQQYTVDFSSYVGTDSLIVFKYDMPIGGWTVLDDINYSIGTPVQNIYTSTNLSIYPNPAFSSITIDTDEVIESIRIYNLNGQLVKFVAQSVKNIDIQDLQKGFYIIETQTPKGILQSKITKL